MVSYNYRYLNVELLRIRYFQIKRAYLVPLAFYFLLGLFMGFNADSSSTLKILSLSLAPALIIYLYHGNRTDLHFINMQFIEPKLQIALNYNLLILPITVGILCSSNWYCGLASHVLISIVAMFENKFRLRKWDKITTLVPAEQFEWIAGLRKKFPIMIVLYLLSYVLFMTKLFPLIPILLVSLIIMDFYSAYEPLVMLNPDGLNVKEFLEHKIRFNVKILIASASPVIILNSIFHPDMFAVNLLFLLAIILCLINAIYIKYATYTPNDQLRFHADFVLLVFAIIIPYFIPISFILMFINRKKAYKHLEQYFNDIS